MIAELGGKPALLQLQELFDTLGPETSRRWPGRDCTSAGSSTSIATRSSRGDFLVRNVQGADRQTGAIAIGDWVRVGQTVQFHVRDAATADEDLNALLAAAKASGSRGPAQARCCSPAMVAARGCSTIRTTTRARSPAAGRD